ncbi:glycosyl transferase family 2 [Vagococcus penaei]|uniref:Glycosyl transferase family 2 n=1 Tax=Vagococcus penaei TaxID=633807 RepID=A0A1Q2D3S6_9ENTE|nr:glycosyltransferase family 2 protein [Vagococcus penaei]AQP53050.1 glycosyl transferase family 2 [Vagococcus penaei]RSU06087.1 glycosyl transferase family 2 [Vagococcus penaei]
MKKVLLVIPAYNEEGNILDNIKKVESYKQELPFQLDYIIVNDGSTDKTKEIIETNKLNAVHLIKNLGIGGAMQTGYLYAYYHDYDIAVQFDGDGQHDIRSINNLVQPILTDVADFTIGSRFTTDSPSEFKTSFSRRMGIKIISFCIKLVTGKKVYDVTSGYRAANKEIIDLFAHDYPLKYPEPELTAELIQKKYRVSEIGANMFERLEGQSSITQLKSVVYMAEVCTSILLLFGKGSRK